MEWCSIHVLEWPGQRPNLNPIENLWHDLKTAVHERCPCNLTERELCCKEEWAKLAKDKCAKLVASYSKRLFLLSLIVPCSCNCCQRCTNKVLSKGCVVWSPPR
uniref:Tc1-like transposase DDE domain-containing protein n=1 Tax=Denticeps clupeoides TaxID=299321 RepID=A0AAY4ASL0_9TELE